MLNRWVNKIAIVTGASSGIGAAIAQKLVQGGLIVVGIARRVELIQTISEQLKNAKGNLIPFKADVTKEKDILALFEFVKTKLGPVHVLINNAGITRNTNLSDGDTSKWREILETNVLAPCVTTREAIRVMKKHAIEGQIIHISSVLGHYVAHIPNLNMYPASKFAIRALTETLRQEFLAENVPIRVCTISPGPTDTEINKLHSNNGSFANIIDAMPKLKAEDVADAIVYVLSTPHHVQVQDIMIRPLGEPV
nr:farnesol dehydrogenase-like [Onthophagus taurus]XP_022902753.1 farnesol dehydrogenase-like [Onthophagus taurus]XP_022902754.1 farnesol dehydrogenase-like [Onthophagus taurus]XP_022902755.1 farnesol dehydrogenase-like [Onthophagus taurus]XP_022902756.1 farnesol dehydrogenase-like [Onthophagus taurus]XP_022902757.1 farnesol dehydrogenase-like [Onthophagus taurus]XP_022902758.1 farnesol dehydrogenase-like [Onthophagus taurus]